MRGITHVAARMVYSKHATQRDITRMVHGWSLTSDVNLTGTRRSETFVRCGKRIVELFRYAWSSLVWRIATLIRKLWRNVTFSVYESLFERTAWPWATVKQSKFSKVKNNAFSTKRFGSKKGKEEKRRNTIPSILSLLRLPYMLSIYLTATTRNCIIDRGSLQCRYHREGLNACIPRTLLCQFSRTITFQSL